MANLSGFNRITKLQNIFLHSNFSGVLKPSSSSLLYQKFSHMSTTGSNAIKTNSLSSQTSASLYHQHQNHKQYMTHNTYRSYSSTKQTSSTSPLDDFRSSEEQKEEQYAKQSQEIPADEETKRADKEDAFRKQILDAALRHVVEHGWSRQALVQGAADLGLPGVAHGLFPEGTYALIAHFYAKCNEELVVQMLSETDNGKKIPANPIEFLARYIRARLEMIVPYEAHWAQALAVLSLPQNVPRSLAQLLTLVDDICYYSGDRSVDFGWYTRRVGIATIYKMVELYMIQDSSPNHQETWIFLKNRLEEAGQLEQVLSHTEGITSNVQKSLSSAFVTARNLLGLNYDRR